MNIFPFLAAIVLYFLAFMEWDPPKHAAYVKLGLNLGELENKLKGLMHKICKQSTTTKEVDKKAVDRIKKVFNEVKEARLKYSGKVKKEIEKDISIKEPVGKMEKLIDEFHQKKLYSDDALNALMNKIEEIWKEKIRDVVNEVMDDN